MAFESDPCAVYAATGELLARGFVREHDEARLTMAAETFTGAWLDAGDRAIIEVMSTDRGVLTFDAVVESSELGRVVLGSLVLQEAVQHRASLRVRTDMLLHLSALLVGSEEQVLDPPWQIQVDDLSADGMRFRTSEVLEVLEVGHRIKTSVPVAGRPMELVLEVVRHEEVRGGLAYGCRILGVSERGRDALFSIVLEMQRQTLMQRAERR